MKTLVTLAIILAIFSVYFIFNTEKSISVKGNALPTGTDIAALILKKVKNIDPKIKLDGISKSKIADIIKLDEIKLKVGDIKNKIIEESGNLIKEPIKNKINDVLCSQG